MSRLFVANLNFEQQIAGDRLNLPVALEQRAAEQACGWLAVAQPGDFLWCPLPVPREYWEQMSDHGLPLMTGISRGADAPSGLELIPWGWSATVQGFARSVRARCLAPEQETVRRVNSRRFGLELERRWNVGLVGAVAVTSLSELEQALRGVSEGQRWVLKSEFSAAARQRIVCAGPTPDDTAAGWIHKRLAARERLFFEPWVDRIGEAGLQWTIPQSGTPVLEGVTELLTDAGGQYTGSGFGLNESAAEVWQPAIDAARQAIDEIQRTGYFGPVGIDAMRYRAADGSERIRPLQDINARWTMGRLALGWQRLMPSGVWRHGTVDEFAEQLLEDGRIIRTSPKTVGDRRAGFATWLEPRS